VIDWVSTVFKDVLPEMKGLEWGRLYEEHHGKSYDPNKMSEEVKKLAADDSVTSRKGSSSIYSAALSIRSCWRCGCLTKRSRRAAYAKQTQAVAGKDKSNCPLCAVGHGCEQGPDL
jgi:hypothetical protein